jgi:dimeric dUTPase (all-alpha-NTP-PPase superfamily)
MDKLERIFEMQNLLDTDIRENRNLEFSKEEWMQKEVLAMLSELSEVLDEVNFKWWKNKKPVNDEALQGELVDILHFFVSMCLHAGLSAETLYEKYMLKNKENFDRQYGRSDKKGYEIEPSADENGGES